MDIKNNFFNIFLNKKYFFKKNRYEIFNIREDVWRVRSEWGL